MPLAHALDNRPRPGATLASWSESQEAIEASVDETAIKVFESYLKFQWSLNKAQKLELCVQSAPDYYLSDQMTQAISSFAFSYGQKVLAKSNSILLRNYSRLLEKVERQAFRLFGHSRENSIYEKKGGYNRGKQSLFLDLSLISPDEWLVIYIHETFHALDTIISSAVQIYGDKKFVKTVAELARSQPNIRQWSSKNLAMLDKFLMAGIDRGYLAEVRAWALTYFLYLEGRRFDRWPAIKTMDKVLKSKLPKESLVSFFARYLAPNWADPKEDIFILPAIQTRLKEIRLSLASGTQAIQLDTNFRKILSPAPI